MRLSLVAVVERREEGTGFELKMRQCTDDLANFPSLSEIPRVTSLWFKEGFSLSDLESENESET